MPTPPPLHARIKPMSSSVPTIDTSNDPAQPSRFVKKMNIQSCAPLADARVQPARHRNARCFPDGRRAAPESGARTN